MWLSVLRYRRIQVALALASSAAVIAACNGDGGGNPASPSPNPGIQTVTVAATGVSPKEVRVTIGDRVRFVNSDTVNRQINSNPFPTHGDCPPINEVALLTPVQSKTTGVLSLEGACGFHEHLTEGSTEFQGIILVGNASPDDAPPTGY